MIRYWPITEAEAAALSPERPLSYRAQRYLGDDISATKVARLELSPGRYSRSYSGRLGFDGNVSERCLEFAALDRVLYNPINNAARHTADGNVDLAIQPCEPDHPHNLRFIMANRLADAQRQVLQERFREHLGDLFRGGFSTGGAGLGMRICADFVCHAYGLATVDEGIAGDYFGARLLHAAFVNWFHWPVAAGAHGLS